MTHEEFTKMLDGKIELMTCMFVACHWKQPELFNEIEFDKNKLNDDGKFYYSIALRMWLDGNTNFSQSTTEIFFDNHQGLKQGWDDRGGYSTIKSMISVCDVNNIGYYQNSLIKYLYAKELLEKGFDVSKIPLEKFDIMNAEQLYHYFDHQLNDTNMQICTDLNFESLDMSDEELQAIIDGENLGLQYWKACPILNSMTMGIPKSELSSVSGYVNAGKTSFVFANMCMPILEEGHRVLLISNEQKSEVFKQLLIIYVLTKKLNYWKITRKKLKRGKFSEEELAKINEARVYIKENYSKNLIFLKLYDYSTDVVQKAIKKYSALGVELVIFDVLKAENAVSDGSTWQQLIEASKDLFKCASKYNIAVVSTQQLALATKGKTNRIGIESLANGKQSSEVQSEMIMLKQLDKKMLDPENKKWYINPYTLIYEDGKYIGKKEITLNSEEKRYYAVFLAKSRNDEMSHEVLFEFNGNFNSWKEIGYCSVPDITSY